MTAEGSPRWTPRTAELDPAAVRAHGPALEPAPAAPAPQEVTLAGTRLAPVPVPPQPPARKPRRFLWKALAASLGLFLGGALAVDAWMFLAAMFAESLWLGSAFAGLLGVVLSSGILLILREISVFGRQMRRLHEAEATAAEAEALLAENGHGKALSLAARILDPYERRPELKGALERFRAAATTAHSDRQVLSLLADTVVRPLDRRAYAVVARAARDTGTVVALSPFGVLDVAIVLWRSLRMIREVAETYGFRPGFFGRVSLFKRVLSVAATAGAGDFVATTMLSHFGARLGGLLSARAGEGLLTGTRTARLGLLTMAACRPVPFLDEDRASIRRLTSEVASSFGKTEDAGPGPGTGSGA